MLSLTAPAVHAHSGEGASIGAAAEPWLVTALMLTGLLYACGAYRLARSARAHRSHVIRCAAWFAIGWSVLSVAFVSPLAAATQGLFSAHMIQHELLMVLGAPLMVLGRPLALWAWALPRTWRGIFARPFRGARTRSAWRFASAPIVASALHAAAIWVWHVPALFERAEASLVLHTLQHCAFLFTALLFWWAVLMPGRASAIGACVLCLFITMLHTGALGVLLTFSGDVWYPASTAASFRWALTPLEDQQLGGLVMWIPGGIPYVVAALILAGRWFSLDDPRQKEARNIALRLESR